MQNRAAKIISIVFHPILMPLYGILILYNSGTYITYLPAATKQISLIIIAVSTIILPLSMIPFYLSKNIIGSVQMESSRERIIPLAMNTIFYFMGFYLLNRLQLPDMIITYMLAVFLIAVATLILNLKWKISIHMIGIGGVTGVIAGLYLILGIDLKPVWMTLIITSGFTGFARLYLNKHTPAEVYSGFLTGLILASGVVIFGG